MPAKKKSVRKSTRSHDSGRKHNETRQHRDGHKDAKQRKRGDKH